ncbi:uncharacterized protein OCT59_026639 [Rhizophagus irregularis]|uniref:uncharacterized protein n=1 Tax=Rhizophagus irregularis TaxID=588596 RepID=UPI000CA8A3CA|nr:hypothetical protein OCT59_026639 [Rhizophagus irregularis]
MFVQHFQRDNFQQLNAFKVWENILKWIIAQFPNLPSNPSLYFKDDVNILSKDLRESLVNHFIKNPKPKITKEIRSESIDSNIITIQHVELISRWIDKLRVTDKTKNVYEFNLILRGSRDGFSPSKFHEICDNKYHTISIIKVKDSDEILGGYNPEMWKSNFSDSNTNDSFIFSFKNKENIEDYILSRV